MTTPKVYRFFQRIVREVVTYRENNNITRPDYIQHLITLSKKGNIADDKDVSNGDVSQKNSTYTPRVSTLFMFRLHGVQISSHTPTILNEMLLNHPQQTEYYCGVAMAQMSVMRKHFFENFNANRVKVEVSLPLMVPPHLLTNS